MFILADLTTYCSDVPLANILSIIQKIVVIIQIIVPILAMVSGVLMLVKLLSNPEEKKYRAAVKNALIALILVFLLPSLVDGVMGLFDGKFQLASCWEYAKQVSTIGK